MTNVLHDPGLATKKITDFLNVLNRSGGLNLTPHILACNGQVQPDSSETAGAIPATENTPSSSTTPEITVELTGNDSPLLLARNGELLHAIEHIAAKILRLEPEEHDRISFDAGGFKATRNRELDMMADIAIERVRATGRPYSFSPMSSRERRILHMALAKSGLPTSSSGIGPGRFVVVYPEGLEPVQPAQPSAEDRTQAIRNSFRRR
ncbi:MAG: R3H domain-containing nucleic acid-binding protein [Edaphobacter sp.]